MSNRWVVSALLLASILLLSLPLISADEDTHKYDNGERVVLWFNKFGPYYNPQETYSFSHLPLCTAAQAVGNNDADSRAKTGTYKYSGLGEALEANELVDMGLNFKFKVDVPSSVVCRMTLDEGRAATLRSFISSHYWFQLYLDELPIRGWLGQVVTDEPDDPRQQEHHHEDNVFVYTDKKFSVGYNGDQIIEVNLTMGAPMSVEAGKELVLTYEVQWVQSALPFEARFDRYLDNSFFEHHIHWFSILNSFMMVIALCGLVSLILFRTLKKDFAKFARDEDDLEDLDRGVGDESGWKQVHGDVFRQPPQLELLSALLGTGFQLLVLVLGLVLLSILGKLYTERGTTTGSALFLYSLTSFLSGYVSGSHYMKYNGRRWVHTMLLSSALFPVVCGVMAFTLNLIALVYSSLSRVSLSSMFVLALIWLLVVLPLTLLGTLVGRRVSGTSDFPCRVNSLRRPIPEKRWYSRPPVISLLGGILPFATIFIEMFFILTSFWNHKFYYVYGFMLLVLLLLLVVLMCVAIVVTYTLLNAEDYRWAWTAFCSTASIAVYAFLYSVYYFLVKTKMSGFFQTCFYFAYTGMFCCGLALMCGAVGYLSAALFVRVIYRNIKSD